MMLVSYDLITTHDDLEVEESAAKKRIYHTSFDQFFSLVYVLVYFLLSRGHRFLFVGSLSFLALCVGMLSVIRVMFHGKLLFSFQGKLLIVGQTLLNVFVAFEAEQGCRAR